MAKLTLKPGQSYEERAQELLDEVIQMHSDMAIANHLNSMLYMRYKEANEKVLTYSQERMKIHSKLQEYNLNLLPDGTIEPSDQFQTHKEKRSS